MLRSTAGQLNNVSPINYYTKINVLFIVMAFKNFIKISRFNLQLSSGGMSSEILSFYNIITAKTMQKKS